MESHGIECASELHGIQHVIQAFSNLPSTRDPSDSSFLLLMLALTCQVMIGLVCAMCRDVSRLSGPLLHSLADFLVL